MKDIYFGWNKFRDFLSKVEFTHPCGYLTVGSSGGNDR